MTIPDIALDRHASLRKLEDHSPLVSMVWKRPLIFWPDASWTTIREPSVKALTSPTLGGPVPASYQCPLLWYGELWGRLGDEVDQTAW